MGLKNREIKFYTYIIIVSLAASSLAGCAGPKETVKGILGISTKILEDKRPQAVKETINANYNTCYRNVLEIVGRSNMYIYAKDRDRGLIAAYVSETDTTPVGIFFTRLDKSRTLIEISSPSPFAKEAAATEILSKLLISLNP